MRPSIAIVNSSSFGRTFPDLLDRLNAFADVVRVQVPVNIEPAQFADKLAPFNGIIASVNPDYPAAVLKELKRLVIITRHGIGYNNVDVRAAAELGVAVTKVEGIVERAAVAEQSIALMLSACRNIVRGDAAVRESRWADRASLVGVELKDRAIGIVGLGNIGGHAASILSHGFGSKVLACDPRATAEDFRRCGAQAVSFEELLREAEVISLHAALSEANYHLLGSAQFALMKPGAIIVNTARGELIDEQALLAALDSGKVRAYAADVVEGEPIGGDHRLLKHPNVIIVPHLGGYTYESLRGMGETMVRNMEQVFLHKVMPENVILQEMRGKGLRKWD